MNEARAFERLIKRDRLITLAGLFVLSALAWFYIASGAGAGMTALEMTSFTLFPHHETAAVAAEMEGPGMETMMPARQLPSWGLSTWALLTAMWWMMMIAMMAPSAAPTILLYARVHRHALGQGQTEDKLAPTGAFAGGYLVIWLGFSMATAALHWSLERTGLMSGMGSQSRWLSVVVLLAAGAYQFSPLKAACLSHCRAPAEFLSRHWRPHNLGALRLGAMHGAYCVGCCWILMALLFVGGAMNLAWIAALTLLVMMEKLVSAGRWIGRGAGLILIGWGIATIFV